MAKWSAKDPEDIRDYWLDCRPLLADDETITDATVEVIDDDHDVPVVKVSSSIATDDVWIVARYSGGSVGTHRIQYHFTTSTGQEFDLTKDLPVKERTA